MVLAAPFITRAARGDTLALLDVPPDGATAPSRLRTMDLAYNGLMLGAACHDGEPGNRAIRNYSSSVRQNALVMYLEHLDPIVAFSTENRIDHFPLGATAGGYSDKTVVRVKRTGAVRAAAKGDTLRTVDILQVPQGGDIRWRLARVSSAETSTGTLAVDPIVGQTDRIFRTGLNEAWAAEWARCGGTGSVPDSFVQYPTIWLQKPVDPVALGWQIGDRIAFLVDNSAPDSSRSDMAPPFGRSRWSSLNLAFRRDRPDVDRSAYRYQRNVGLWWNSYAYDTEYYPIFLIGHRQPGGPMIVKGNAYGGYAGDGEVTFAAGTRLRQVVKIPEHPGWAGRTIKAVDASLWRWNADMAGSVDLALRRLCPTLAATQDGTLLAQASIAAGSLVNANGDIKFNVSRVADPRQTLALPTHIPVSPGETYHIELAPGPGSAVYAVGRVLNYLRASRGLLQPDYQDSSCVHQRKVGDGDWTTITDHVSASNYLHLGVGLHFNG